MVSDHTQAPSNECNAETIDRVCRGVASTQEGAAVRSHIERLQHAVTSAMDRLSNGDVEGGARVLRECFWGTAHEPAALRVAAERVRDHACSYGAPADSVLVKLELIGELARVLGGSISSAQPPGDGRREIDHLRHALLLIRSGPPPHMGNGEVASWAAHIASAALLPTLANQAESPPEDSQELRDARFAIGALIAAAGGRVVIMPSVLVNLDQRSEIETFDDPVSGARIFSLKSPTATK